jgi:hypothetical protein
MSNKRGRHSTEVRDGDVIYAIRRLSDGAIKLGKTQNLKRRLGDIRLAYGAVELIATTA